MIDLNDFKRKVKAWLIKNPQADEFQLLNYCESLIPPSAFETHRWILEQTLGWYRYVKFSSDEDSDSSSRKNSTENAQEEPDKRCICICV